MAAKGKKRGAKRGDESKLKSPKKAERMEDLEPEQERSDAVKGGYAATGKHISKAEITL